MGGEWRASSVASNTVWQGGSNRIVCSLEIFSDRERPAGRTAERVERVFVLISSKQEMRLSIGERFVSAPLHALLFVSYSRLIRRGVWGTKPPEMRISIHLTGGITVACRYFESTVLASKLSSSRSHLLFDSGLPRSCRLSRRPEAIVKVV